MGPHALDQALPGWSDETASVAHCITQIRLPPSRYEPPAGVHLLTVVGSPATDPMPNYLDGRAQAVNWLPKGAVVDRDLIGAAG